MRQAADHSVSRLLGLCSLFENPVLAEICPTLAQAKGGGQSDLRCVCATGLVFRFGSDFLTCTFASLA
jgi:hypothetical protein